MSDVLIIKFFLNQSKITSKYVLNTEIHDFIIICSFLTLVVKRNSLADRISELKYDLYDPFYLSKVPLPLKYCFAFYNQMSLWLFCSCISVRTVHKIPKVYWNFRSPFLLGRSLLLFVTPFDFHSTYVQSPLFPLLLF